MQFTLPLLGFLTATTTAQLHHRSTRSLSNDSTIIPWNITFAEYLPSSQVSAVNFIITRLTDSVCTEGFAGNTALAFNETCPVDTVEIDTLCTGVWTRNTTTNDTLWQSCSYYQYENGTKAGDLLSSDGSLAWKLVDEHAFEPYSFALDVFRNNQTWEYGFNSTNLECAFIGRGGRGEDCRLKGSYPRGVLLGSGNSTSNGTVSR